MGGSEELNMQNEMKNYIFKTITTMKKYNNKKWYIDSDVIPEFQIKTTSINEALLKYKEFVYKEGIINISDNALKTKQKMYVDTIDGSKQVGYVITGQTEILCENYKWSKQYVDLWVRIFTVVDTEF